MGVRSGTHKIRKLLRAITAYTTLRIELMQPEFLTQQTPGFRWSPYRLDMQDGVIALFCLIVRNIRVIAQSHRTNDTTSDG